MRAGDVLNGYTILEDFKVVGAGLSKWTFAERGGRAVLHQGVPQPDLSRRERAGQRENQGEEARPMCGVRGTSPGRPTRTRPAVRVRRKPHRHARLLPLGCQVLQGDREGRRRGSEQRPTCGTRPAHSAGPDEDRGAQPENLHDLKIVHSDLKPSNVLIKQTELGYTTKLIDFDSSYIAGRPPPPEEIVGTINYYSPELLGYIQEAGVTCEPNSGWPPTSSPWA